MFGIARVGSRRIASAFPAVYSRNVADKTMEYLDKEIEPKIEDIEEQKKLFLRGLPEAYIQSDAWRRASISVFRNNSTVLHEGQHPEVVKAIEDANKVDAELDRLLSTVNEDAFHDQVRHFSWGKYRNGDEDSVLYHEINWDFFRSVFPDAAFIDSMKNTYETLVDQAYKDSVEEDPIPKEFKVLDRIVDQFVCFFCIFFYFF